MDTPTLDHFSFVRPDATDHHLKSELGRMRIRNAIAQYRKGWQALADLPVLDVSDMAHDEDYMREVQIQHNQDLERQAQAQHYIRLCATWERLLGPVTPADRECHNLFKCPETLTTK
jgi:hypothetical protein